MHCCICSGACNHVGGFSYCETHKPHPVGVCPNCGYCPTCGRTNARPHNPWQPYTQPWTSPFRFGDVYIGDPPGSLGHGISGTSDNTFPGGLTVRY